MITVKLLDILNASGVRNQNTPEQENTGLAKIMELPLSAKLSYRLSKLAKEINAKKVIFQETQKKLFEKYGEKVFENVLDKDNNVVVDDKGNIQKRDTNQIQLFPENIEKFNKEMEELLVEDETLNAFPIPLQMIEECGAQIASNDMLMILPFIIDEDGV